MLFLCSRQLQRSDKALKKKFRKDVAGVFYLSVFGCNLALEQLYWLDNHIRDAVERSFVRMGGRALTKFLLR